MRVTGTGETAIYVTCMYMPPNSVNTETLSKIESYIDSLIIEPQSYNIVCGDFNINFLKNNQKRETLKEIMKGCCMKTIDENSITRETTCSKSNLDIFFAILQQSYKLKRHVYLIIILYFLVFRQEHRWKTNLNTSLQETGKNLKISP